MATYALHWFRRDLRVSDNPALHWSAKEHGGRVLGVYCVDPKERARSDFSPDRFAFLCKTLAALRDELRDAGGDLLVLDEGPEAAFPRLLAALDARPATVSFSRDYEPAERARDATMHDLFADGLGLGVHTERGNLLVEPDELRKPSAGRDDATFYQVYTPFARRWFELRARHPRGAKTPPRFTLTWAALFRGRAPVPDHLTRLTKERGRARVPLPDAGSVAARERLRAFAARLDAYKERRDLPAENGTSRLSVYLKNGSLSPAQASATLGLGEVAFAEASGRSTFLRELAWREFYCHVLWHRPDVETRAFLPRARDLPWENRQDWFDAWKAGRTGFPIVDAGMRQLAQTGWMHNRVRMIVASFLTKDLLIDWRWGERHFMERLLDGELASNNGGWQWAASTGCDPQPYFRVFNPVLQGRRFDPDGAYVRAFVPERRGDGPKDLHEPRDALVDHAVQKEKALALFRDAR